MSRIRTTCIRAEKRLSATTGIYFSRFRDQLRLQQKDFSPLGGSNCTLSSERYEVHS